VSRGRILLVDDEASVRFGIRDFLETHGFEVLEADTVAEAERLFRARRPEVAVVDYALPDGNALELLPRLRAHDPRAALVVLTAHGSIELAVRAIKEGAEQFLTKPVELAALLVVLERQVERQRAERRQAAGSSREEREAVDPFLGTSAAIRAVAADAARLVESDSPILIEGETGAGKGVLARWLHQHGRRAKEAFVDVNCAGLGRELLEAELFGHEKGAFTGAVGAKVGLLQVADRGTLFLDEIGDLQLEVQPKLLKVLEEQRFRRVGDVRDREVDVRLIAATHQDLAALVRERAFRSDLFFRIAALRLRMPPLRERAEDIPLLAEGFLARLAHELGRHGLSLSEDARRALLAYPWPGNIRELRNVLERAVLLSRGPVLAPSDLRFDAVAASGRDAGDADDSTATLAEVERRHIERVLAEEGGHVERAAKRLGVPRSSLYERLKRHGIERRPT
jgi:DNA-binding NtrC family response regulator